MSTKEELEFYKEALKDYRKSLIFGRRKFHTSGGFCYYFSCKSSIDNLPFILESLKPKKTYATLPLYWFKPGALLPRIKLLKKAIKICKKRLA